MTENLKPHDAADEKLEQATAKVETTEKTTETKAIVETTEEVVEIEVVVEATEEIVEVETKAIVETIEASLEPKTEVKVEAEIAKVETGVKAEAEIVEAEIAQVEAGVKVEAEIVEAEIAQVEAGVKVEAEIVEAEIAQVEAGVKAEAEIAKVETKAIVETIEEVVETEVVVEAAEELKTTETKVTVEAETNAAAISAKETPKTGAKTKVEDLSKDELVERIKKISQLAVADVPQRSEVEVLKQAYYHLRAAEVEAEKEAFIAADADNLEADFQASVDPSEDVMKMFLEEIKNKRATQLADEKRTREANYKKKLTIIEEIKALTESSEDFNKLYKDYRNLQEKWNSIKLVPHSKERELWTAYQIQSEVFYDLIKINNELRDYDFKKNLEQKIKYCEAAEKLADEADIVSAFHQLQNYHKLWREVGPVDRDIREEIWARFSEASRVVNKRYQDHFEELKKDEDQNLIEKNAIIEKLKELDCDNLDSFKKWNEKTREVIELQSRWRTIGFVPRRLNNKVYEEFREICDKFFNQKSKFFRAVRDEMDKNLVKKQELCKKANELKDSTDWKATTPKMIDIQRQWKAIGPVPRKDSDAIWKEFVAACDYFFEQKKENEVDSRKQEKENLKAKTEIVEKISQLDSLLTANELLPQLKTLADEWYTIGFVPFKQKDKCYEDLRAAIDKHYDRLKIDKSQRRMDNFKSNMEQIAQHDNPTRALHREKEQLTFRYNKLKADLQTYETNMSFLSISSSSKGANSLLKDVNAKIEGLRSEMGLISEKLKTVKRAFAELED